MKPAVLMIGGGLQQVEAVRVAREAGFRVFVSDRRPDAPAFAGAEECWVVDGEDVPELARRAIEARERGLAGVFTLTELVETVAEVARAAGLPGVDPAAARASQDKAVAKERWLGSGVPTPRGGATRDLDGARELFAELDERAFVKPARGFGGRGGARVEAYERLEPGFRRAAEVSLPVVVEELLDGTHHDVNGILDGDGRLHEAGVWDRGFHLGQGHELEGHAPGELSPERRHEALELTRNAALALGIDWGPVKADLVLTADGFRVLELAPRLHGPKGTLHLIPLATGAQPLAAALRVATGAVPGELDLEPRRVALFLALESPTGVLQRISGVDAALALPGVERVAPLVAPGASLSPVLDATGVPGHVFVTGETLEEARARAEAAAALIRFETIP